MDLLTIRRAVQADLPAVLTLYVQAGLESETTLDAGLAARIWERIQSYPDYHIYAAFQGSQVVGAFELLIMESTLDSRFSNRSF